MASTLSACHHPEGQAATADLDNVAGAGVDLMTGSTTVDS